MIYKTEFQKKAEYGEILMYNNGIHVDANVILKFVDDTLMPRCLVWIESSMRFCGVFLFSYGYLGYFCLSPPNFKS